MWCGVGGSSRLNVLELIFEIAKISKEVVMMTTFYNLIIAVTQGHVLFELAVARHRYFTPM